MKQRETPQKSEEKACQTKVYIHVHLYIGQFMFPSWQQTTFKATGTENVILLFKGNERAITVTLRTTDWKKKSVIQINS